MPILSMFSLSSVVTLSLHPPLSFQGCSWNAWNQRARKHPPAGPAPGPGHPARTGCAERRAEVRRATAWTCGWETPLYWAAVAFPWTICDCSKCVRICDQRTMSQDPSFRSGCTLSFPFYDQLSSSLETFFSFVSLSLNFLQIVIFIPLI